MSCGSELEAGVNKGVGDIQYVALWTALFECELDKSMLVVWRWYWGLSGKIESFQAGMVINN